MKPCSAYCRPDEGVHVVATNCALTADDLNTDYLGIELEHGVDSRTHLHWCIPFGTRFSITRAEPAVESALNPEAFWEHPVLITIRCATADRRVAA